MKFKDIDIFMAILNLFELLQLDMWFSRYAYFLKVLFLGLQNGT